MIVEQSKQIITEVNKAFIGKNEIVEKVLMTIYAGGHVLLEDCPVWARPPWLWPSPRPWA